MAENFTIVYQRQTEELVGGSRVRDVMEIGFETIPSDIYAQFRLALGSYNTTFVEPVASHIAEEIEQVAAFNNVAGMFYIQDINAAGLLIDVMEIIVTSTSGNSSGVLHLRIPQLSPFVSAPLVNALVAKLDAIENL